MRKKTYLKLVEYQTEQSEKHLSEVRSIHKEMRGYKHDFHPHLQALKGQLEAGEVERAVAYIEELDNSLMNVDTLLKTGNISLDAILSAKIAQAKVENIAVTVTANVPDTLTISDLELSIIIGNLLDNAIDCYNMGKDVRLYRQDKLIMKIKILTFELHKKAFRTMEKKRYVMNIPLMITKILLQAVIYIFVCVYALLGVFGVGSIVKYVGFVETIIGCITSYFAVFADIKYNTPFVEDYLAYIDIPQKMYQGSLTVEKRDDNEYYVEFKNVSFKYPGAETYALRHVNMKFKVGERLAVVGMNGSGKTTFI